MSVEVTKKINSKLDLGSVATYSSFPKFKNSGGMYVWESMLAVTCRSIRNPITGMRV